MSHLLFFFFFNDTATTEIYTLSLHDALPICGAGDSRPTARVGYSRIQRSSGIRPLLPGRRDRKSTRLNSSHGYISYAVFCLKKKKQHHTPLPHHQQSTSSSRRRGNHWTYRVS